MRGRISGVSEGGDGANLRFQVVPFQSGPAQEGKGWGGGLHLLAPRVTAGMTDGKQVLEDGPRR